MGVAQGSSRSHSFIQVSTVWLNNIIIGRPEKAVAAALQMGFGNSANFASANVFITGEAPRYPTAFKTGLALAIVGIIAPVLFPILLHRQNKLMDRKEEEA
jgi:hypothetical protein